MDRRLFLIIHNIRSAENVGSMFRTADAFGVSKVYLTGYTPAPLDRFNRPVHKIAKTALGGEKSVAWEQGDIAEVIEKLKTSGTRIVALEQDPRAALLGSYKSASKQTALIVGNEVTGVEPEVLALADAVVEIPMQGTKESLNVAVAAGIALFELTRYPPFLH